MEPDNSLAETLGGLGQALGSALNPLNSLRAYDIQQQLFLRRQQLEQMQRENNAKNAAVAQWGHIVPADKLPQIAAMIYQGAPYDQVARAAAQLSGNLVDDPSPAGLQKNIRYIEQLTGKPYDYAGQGPPVAGVNTAKAFNDWKTQQAGAVSAATEGGKISATRGANAPLVSQYVDQDTPEANANNTRVYMILHNGDLPPNGMPPGIGPNTIAGNNKRAAIAENEKARATAAGTASGAGVDVNQPKLFPQQPPGVYNYGGANAPAQPTPPYPPSPLTLSPAQPTPSAQPLTVQNSAAPYSAPTAIVRPVQGGGTLTGQTQGETTAGTQLAEDNRKVLMGAVDEGASAIQMKNKIAQLRDLSSIVNAGGVGGQVTTAIIKRLADNGIVISNAGEAYKAMDQILNTEIPDLRRASGIQRLAGPEIQAVGKQIGSANLPPDVLNNIIANEEANADIQIARRANAQKALGWGDAPMTMGDYSNADNDLLASLRQHTDALRKQYGAIAPQPGAFGGSPTAPPTAPRASPPAASDANAPTNASADIWHRLADWLGGGAQPAQPPQPAPQGPPSAGIVRQLPDGSFAPAAPGLQ